MLLILLGNTIAAWGRFNAQELIAKGEIFQVQNTISKSSIFIGSQIVDLRH